MRHLANTATVFMCLFVLTSTSFAGNWRNSWNKSQSNTPNLQKFLPNGVKPARSLGQPLPTGGGNYGDFIKKFKKQVREVRG